MNSDALVHDRRHVAASSERTPTLVQGQPAGRGDGRSPNGARQHRDKARPARVSWTAEEDRILAEMAAEGRTGSEIGARLDRSRNSILGRANRLGIRLITPGTGNKNAEKGHSSVGRNATVRASAVFRGETRRHWQREPQPDDKAALHVISNEQKLIEEFIARNGVRRFDAGQTTDRYSIQKFLEERGYTLSGWQGKIKISSGRGRPRKLTWAQVIKLVDELRAAEGLPTFLRSVDA